MATPSRLREDVADVSDDAMQAYRDLVRDVPQDDVDNLLRDELPGLIRLYGETAAYVAAEWYDEARTAAAVSGTFAASLAALPDPGMDALLGWAHDTAVSFPTMLTLIEGGVQKRVANGARLTIADNARRDPRAVGTQRYARTSGGCSFCRMLAGRGFVYRSEDSATFAAHEHCLCVAVPAFKGAPLPVQPYTPSLRNSDADRARVRDWIASH